MGNAEDIFDEFLNGANQDRIGLKVRPWCMPNIQDFVSIATKKLKWEASYAAEKILPMLSRWVLIHAQSCRPEKPLIVPVHLPKKRVKRGCPCYQVQWKFVDQVEHFPVEFQTLEPLYLIEREFPALIPQPIAKPLKKPRKIRAKPNKPAADDVSSMFQQMNLKKKKKPVAEKEESDDISSMFQQMNLEKSKEMSPKEEEFDADLSGGSDDSDLSFIVEMICKRKNKNVDPVLTRICPVGNFSLNFSLGRLANCSENSAMTTPTKNGDCAVAEDDFATPLPLAERFHR